MSRRRDVIGFAKNTASIMFHSISSFTSVDIYKLDNRYSDKWDTFLLVF